jgi:ankyrin repeat protein
MLRSMMRRSMIEVYRLSGTKIHHPISDLDQLFLCRFRHLKIAISSRTQKCLIQALLEEGADKSARNSLGDTPRDDAVTFDQREVVHLL